MVQEPAQYGEKPADIIRREQALMESRIQDVVKDFTERTGVQVKDIRVEFVESRPMGGPYQTVISRIGVLYESVTG